MTDPKRNLLTVSSVAIALIAVGIFACGVGFSLGVFASKNSASGAGGYFINTSKSEITFKNSSSRRVSLLSVYVTNHLSIAVFNDVAPNTTAEACADMKSTMHSVSIRCVMADGEIIDLLTEISAASFDDCEIELSANGRLSAKRR